MKCILWHLNNSDEPEDVELEGFENGFMPQHANDFINYGTWIGSGKAKIWIPPHRILKVEEVLEADD